MRSHDSIFLTHLLLISSVCMKLVNGCIMYRFDTVDDLRVLHGHAFKTTEKSLLNLCWSECVSLSWCLSLNVKQTSEGDFECELNNSSKKGNPSKMAARPEWSYHEMKGLNQNNCQLYECIRKEDLGDGWYRCGDAAVKLFPQKKNWTDARRYCQSLGGDLLSIASSRKNDFINDVFVENMNLTYIQEDNKANYVPNYFHFNLNGQDDEVSLGGEQNDAIYKMSGREKALYLNGEEAYADITPVSLNTDGLSVCFWIKPSTPFQPGTSFHISKDSKAVMVFYWNRQGKIQLKINGIFLGALSLKGNLWQHICCTWDKNSTTVSYGRNGKWQIFDKSKISSVEDIASSDKFRLGYPHKSFYGFLKHLVLVNDSITEEQMQTIMYLHGQGVWIGLNSVDGSSEFRWTDGSPLGQSMDLPDYHPDPALSKRKCVAMANDNKWLDKHCDLKYSFLCEKPAP